MTRARSALVIGKQLVLAYNCSDDVFLHDIADNIRSCRLGIVDWLVSCGLFMSPLSI